MNSTEVTDLLTSFGAVDYAISVIMLAVSLGIGIYFGIFGSKSAAEYLTAGGKMKTVPVAVSLVASQISGVVIVGVAAEVYTFGAQTFITVIGASIGTIIASYIFVPVFFNLRLSNSFEYLEMRFDKRVRKMMAFLFLVFSYLFAPVIIFVASLSFSQVTGINIHVANAVIIIICVTYTLLGGIKAVIWTDVIQAGIIFGSCIIVLVIAVINVGGIDTVVQRASDGGRLNIFNMNISLTERASFWNHIIGIGTLYTGYVGLNQSCIQRYATVPTYRNANMVLFIFIVGFVIFFSVTTSLGIVMYATFYNCDPIKSGVVPKPDRLISHFVQSTVQHIPGMLGLFIAGIASASLSTMSAVLNSSAAIVYQDFVKDWKWFSPTDANVKLFMKTVILISGIYSIAAGFIIEHSPLIIQITTTVVGLTMGTSVGIYILGMLVPIANKLGALTGGITCILVMTWISVGTQVALLTKSVVYQPLPTSVDGCADMNLTTLIMPNSSSIPSLPVPAPEDTFILYRLSFNYYSMFCVVITVVIGSIVSLITGRPDPRSLGSQMFSPSIHWLLPKEMLMDKIEDDDHMKNQTTELKEMSVY